MEQARRLGDRTVLMSRGRIIAEGDSGSLLEDLDPEVRARYMGELAYIEHEHKEGDVNE
jgi:ABC-type branched-subunit amino acid transport system ATPase component